MKKLFALFALLLCMTLSFGSVANAQAEEADVDAAAEAALDADPDALLEGLAEAPDDDLLPESFLNPIDGTPAADPELVDAFALPVGDIDGAVGSVSLPFDADTSIITALVAHGNVNYVVLEDEVTEDDMDDFIGGAEEGLGSDGSVEEYEFGGVTGAVITYSLEQDGVFATVQMLALPVGNVLVLSTVVLADTSEIDADEVLGYAEELLNTGVLHLTAVAEDAQ